MDKEELYYRIRLIRKTEEAIIKEYPSNEIKTPCHLAIGAEAIAVCVTSVFPESAIFASYRNHHWYLASKGDLTNFFLELYGRVNPIADGKAGSMHLNSPQTGLMLTSAVVATQFGPAIGYAFAQRYMERKKLTICVSGDGATEEGAFYESLNLAALYDLDILFVIEDNGLAIHQDKRTRQAFDLEKIASAYGIPYYETYADFPSDVIRLCKKIRIGPAILRCYYHRFYEHVGVNQDYDAGYRNDPRDTNLMDPLFNQSKKLSVSLKKSIDLKVDYEISLALQKAKLGKIPQKEKLLEHVFV